MFFMCWTVRNEYGASSHSSQSGGKGRLVGNLRIGLDSCWATGYNTLVFQIQGKIQYYNIWVLAWLPDGFDKYYRALLPRAWYVKPPMNRAHISIVRKFEEPDRVNWGIHDGKSIIVDIIPGIQTDGTYYWLDCFSDEVGYLRRRLGLSTFRDDDNSYIIYDCYHVTIGNVK